MAGTARLTSSRRQSCSRLLLALTRVQTTSAVGRSTGSFLYQTNIGASSASVAVAGRLAAAAPATGSCGAGRERVDGKLGDADLPIEECAESAARSYEKRHSTAHRYSKARSTRRRLSSGLLPLFLFASPQRRAHARLMRWRRWWDSWSFSAPLRDEAGSPHHG